MNAASNPKPSVLNLGESIAWCRSFRHGITLAQDDLTKLISDEIGKNYFEALTSEIIPLLASCRWHERHTCRLLKPKRLGGASLWQVGQRHTMHRAPLGRVGIIATWNYPIQLLGIQLVQAMLGGNHVVVKPSERSPRSQALLLEIAQSAGARNRIEVREPTREAGEQMLQSTDFDHVIFTGSTNVGRSIARNLAGSLTPSTLELSGNDSAIVLADADIPLAVDSIFYAFRLNAGQTCMAPRRIIVEAPVFEAFELGIAQKLGESEPIQAIDPQVHQQIDAGVSEALKAGAIQLDARFGVVSRCPPTSLMATRETFGPALCIIRADHLEHALEIQSAIDQKLATSIYTRDERRAMSLAPMLGSGVVTINDSVIPTGHPGLAISGQGASGWGASRGELGLLAMTRPVHISRTMSKIRTPLAPPPRPMQEKITKFVRWWYGRR